MKKKELRRRLVGAENRINVLMDEVAILDRALENERQWRLKSLPALLAAEERANRAEARVAELESVIARELTQFPELSRSQAKRHAALINAYHETTERP